MRTPLIGLLLVVLATGCGNGSDPPPAQDAAPPASDFTVALASDSVAVITGSSVGVSVTVDRDPAGAGALAGDVTISIVGLPPGVTIDPLVIPATLTEGTLIVRADADAPQILAASLTVNAALGDIGHTAPLALTVRGPAGTLDTTFGNDGIATFVPAVGSFWSIGNHAAAIDSAGRILVSGSDGADIAVARLLPSGLPDTTFGGDGIASVDCGFGTEKLDAGYAVAVDPSDNVFVAGGANHSSDGITGYSDLCVVRFRAADGAPDPTFGTGGVRVDDAGGSSNELWLAAAARPDGSLVVMGFTDGGPVGRLITADGQSGLDVTPDGTYSDDVEVLADGSFLTLSHSGSMFAVTKWLPGGSIDATFGAGGSVAVTAPGGEDRARGLGVQSDGKIIFGVGSQSGPSRALRVSATGAPDTWGRVFGSGMTVIGFEANGDRALAFGETSIDSVVRPTLVRLSAATGDPDVTFGTDGYAILTEISIETTSGLVAQPDGQIVVVGSLLPSPYVMRIWP
jgi:uncharacterized delta-60 repeat protein